MQSLPEHAEQLLTTSAKVTKHATNIFICVVSTTMQSSLAIIYCPLTSQGRGHCNFLTIWGYIVSRYVRVNFMGPIPCNIGYAMHNPTYCVTITF